jgi:hypothetical protein
MEFPTTPDTEVSGIEVYIAGGSGEMGIRFVLPNQTVPGVTQEVVAAAFLDFVSVLVATAEANKPTGTTITANAQYTGGASALVTIP